MAFELGAQAIKFIADVGIMLALGAIVTAAIALPVTILSSIAKSIR